MALAYTAPTWVDGSGEGLSASNLQAISNCIEGLVQGSDKAIHNIAINNGVMTITYVDGTIDTDIAVGMKGISNIAKTSTVGNVDTYTVTYTDGSTFTFTITNGRDGAIQYTAGANITISDENEISAIVPDVSEKADITAIAPNEPNATASQDYAAGEHFYKNGKFCTAKTAIASGATFTLGTNYTEGTVADALSIDYRISEQNTGISWVNGEPIYCITKEVQITGSDTTFYIDLSSLNIKSVLRMETQKYAVNGSSWPIGVYWSASLYDTIQYDNNNSRIIYSRSSSTAWNNAYVSVTLYYTKAS